MTWNFMMWELKCDDLGKTKRIRGGTCRVRGGIFQERGGITSSLIFGQAHFMKCGFIGHLTSYHKMDMNTTSAELSLFILQGPASIQLDFLQMSRALHSGVFSSKTLVAVYQLHLSSRQFFCDLRLRVQQCHSGCPSIDMAEMWVKNLPMLFNHTIPSEIWVNAFEPNPHCQCCSQCHL